MIFIVKGPAAHFPFCPRLDDAKMEYRAIEYGELSDADMLKESPSVFILQHSKAILHAQSLRAALGGSLQTFRILVLLDSDAEPGTALRARLAGADVVLFLPIAENIFLASLRMLLRIARQTEEMRPLIQTGFVFSARYKTDGVIGAGPHGVMLSALDKTTGKPAVVKFLNDAILESPEQLKDFQVRTDQLEGIKVSEYAPLLATGDCFSIPFLVYGCGRCRNLYEYMGVSDPPLSEPVLVEIALACVRALVTFRNNGTVHLDVKPENILVFGHNFTLTEFGISAMGRTLSTHGHSLWQDPSYTPPEFFQKNGILTPRSDVFALGMVLYTCAAKDNLFLGRPFAEPPTPETYRPLIESVRKLNLTPLFKSTLESMLSFYDDDRPRLRMLETVFTQMRSIESLEQTPEYLQRKKEEDEARRREEAEKARLERKKYKQEFTKIGRWSHFLQKFQYVILLTTFALIFSILTGYWIGISFPPKTHFQQGPLGMFTCYSGHTVSLRTLDCRTVRCPECGERTSPSYTCGECGKVYGLSLWPMRDMTEEESAAFEERLKRCPFCASTKIFQTPVLTEAEKKAEADKKKK